MNEFERKLRQQPFRPLPPSWKAEIFAALGQPATARSSSENEVGGSLLQETVRGGRRFFGVPISPSWREWLWPAPVAWAAILVSWAGLFALYLSAPEAQPAAVAHTGPPPTTVPRGSLLVFQTQHHLAAELAGFPPNLQ